MMNGNFESGVCRIEKWVWNSGAGMQIWGRWVFQGTGFLYGDNKRILTNTHVTPELAIDHYYYRAVFMVNGAQEIRKLTNKNVFAGGLILGTQPHVLPLPNYPRVRVDICSCAINAPVEGAHVFRAVDLHTLINERPNDQFEVTVYHYPRGNPMTRSPLLRLWPLLEPTHFWYTANPPTQPGSSGAPLVLQDGRVCGVNFAGDLVDSIAVPMQNVFELQHIQLVRNVETENLLRFGRA
eukprot:scaffold9780_cov140-Ochromonas_danica.AAC.1